MADIRDVESLVQYLFRMADDDRVKDPYKRARIHAYRDAFERLLALPIIPTEPDCDKCKSHMAFLMAKMAYDERTAKWVSKSGSIYLYCSGCGREKIIDSDNWNYCPNCGARMDLDEV